MEEEFNHVAPGALAQRILVVLLAVCGLGHVLSSEMTCVCLTIP
jgi:hypothetical protein